MTGEHRASPPLGAWARTSTPPFSPLYLASRARACRLFRLSAQAREGPSSILALREPQTRTKAAHAYEPNARPRSAAVAAEAVSGESTHAPGSPALRGPCTEGDDVSLARRSAAAPHSAAGSHCSARAPRVMLGRRSQARGSLQRDVLCCLNNMEARLVAERESLMRLQREQHYCEAPVLHIQLQQQRSRVRTLEGAILRMHGTLMLLRF